MKELLTDKEKEFIVSLKALLVRYNVEITDKDWIESKDDSGDIELAFIDLYTLMNELEA